MARCCGGASCACLIVAGNHFQVSGTGTSQDPFELSADVALTVSDNSVFNLALSGLGTAASPWVLSTTFTSTAKLDDLPDVNAATPTNGQVLGWDSTTSKWTPRNPTTAAAGGVLHDTSLTGDGSAGTPLQVVEDPAGFLQTDSGGLGLTDEGVNSLVRAFDSTTARDVAVPTPRLNTISTLDTAPGRQDYWDGSQWLPVNNGILRDYGTGQEILQISGEFVSGTDTTIMVRQLVVNTDTSGNGTVLSSIDLAGYAGVLSCSVQERGNVGWKAVVNPNGDHMEITAYRLDTGLPYASALLPVTVVAYLY